MTNRRLTIFTFVLSLLFVQAKANVVTGVAAVPDNYYAAVEGKSSAEAILTALNGIISGHTVINYDGLEPYYQQTDFYSDTLWDMYSTCRFVADDANIPQKQLCDGWNKEHVCCQSWLGSGPMVSDLYNVYPTDARVNNLRSNYPYGEVNGANGTGISKDPEGHALGKLGYSSKSIAGYSDRVFEPHDNYKGDFARTFMYMVARYRANSINGGNGAVMFTSSPTNFTAYAKEMLLRWHRADPVSMKEVDRNQAVYGIQHNRNPFIDYPELAEYIWGNKVGQTVNLSSMTPTCESLTPAAQTKYGVTWMVDDEVLRVDSVEENKKPASLPDAPVSCSSSSESFAGWSSASIAGVSQTAPAGLFSEKAQMPAVTSDVVFRAVFAHAEQQQGSGPVTAQTNFSGYSRGNKVETEKAGNITITFAKAGASNAATYYSEVRCYAKSTITFSGAAMTRIEFTAGANDKGNALRPNTGTMSGSVWTGNASSVVFTVDGDSGYRGISAIKVTYEDNTVVTSFSDYITSCGDHTGIENDCISIPTHKILRNGQLLIVIGDQIYNIMGQRIQ